MPINGEWWARFAASLRHRGPGYEPDHGEVTQAHVAFRIRAELVCCDIYAQVNDRKEIPAEVVLQRTGHAHSHIMCYWGEAAARIADGQCPGYETTPNVCRCGCQGCQASCSFHDETWQWPR